MPNQTREDRLKAIHAEALQRFDRIQSALKDERQMCLQDRRFYSIPGAQWEGSLEKQFKSKPKFEVNKIHLAVLRIINEYRNNRITADFVSKDGKQDDELADMCDGLFRADEQDSAAEEAYDNAFEEAVGGGFGALRLRTVYEDEDDPDDERQRIRIEPIYDADTSVWFDLDAKRQDKSDAMYCFVVYSMTRDAFKAKWGEDPASWSKAVHQVEFDWVTPDVAFVAEYYVVDDQGDWRITFVGASGEELKLTLSELDAEKMDELEATGYRETGRRRIRTRCVRKYVLSGSSVLEDSGVIAGKFIPIIPVYGKRWFVDNIERCMGHVRLAKDPQRLKNMQLSMLAELSVMSPVAKPIFSPEQVSGHQDMWANDNIENYPYLLVEPITGADGNPLPAAQLGYTKPPEIPPARAALLQITETDMREILGNPQEAEKVVSNVSGKVLELAKANLDMQTYIYVSNMAKAIRRVGEVWLSMARDIYVEEGREMKTVGTSQEVGTVKIGVPAKDPNDGSLTTGNDLSKAKFDVAVTVGPSSTSRREATVRMLVSMLQFTNDPETAQVLLSMAVMNMEGEGVSDVREFFRKRLVKMGVLKPTDEEAQAMAAAAGQKSANDIALEAMANEADAKATSARADVLKTMAEVEKIKAEVEKTRTETLKALDDMEKGLAAVRQPTPA